jgi:hypothetical protein
MLWGAVLGQAKDKKHHAIAYASKTLTGPQLNYATTEKELLIVVFAINKFRSYLVGAKVIVGYQNTQGTQHGVKYSTLHICRPTVWGSKSIDSVSATQGANYKLHLARALRRGLGHDRHLR